MVLEQSREKMKHGFRYMSLDKQGSIPSLEGQYHVPSVKVNQTENTHIFDLLSFQWPCRDAFAFLCFRPVGSAKKKPVAGVRPK